MAKIMGKGLFLIFKHVMRLLDELKYKYHHIDGVWFQER